MKTQFMALLEDADVTRLDALRIVTGRSRARIVREGIQRILTPLEKKHAAELSRLATVAERRGMSMDRFVAEFVSTHGRAIGPSLETLEAETL